METNILFTGDWHCGLVSWGVDRAEELDGSLRQLIKQVKEYQPEMTVITGDITESFRYPGNKTFKQVSGAIKDIMNCRKGMELVILKGNHDWAGLEIFQEFHKDITFVEAPTIIDAYPYPIIAVPYQKSYQLPEGGYKEVIETLMDKDGRDCYILAAHAGAEGDIPGEPTIPLGTLNDPRIKKAFLGHIHIHDRIEGARNAYYTGTLIRNTFGESASRTGAWMLNYEDSTGRLEARDITIESGPLKTFSLENVSEAIADGSFVKEAREALQRDAATLFRVTAPKHSYREEDVARVAKELREEFGITTDRPVTYPFVAFDTPSAEPKPVEKRLAAPTAISEGISIKGLWQEWCEAKKGGKRAEAIGLDILAGAGAREIWNSLKAVPPEPEQEEQKPAPKAKSKKKITEIIPEQQTLTFYEQEEQEIIPSLKPEAASSKTDETEAPKPRGKKAKKPVEDLDLEEFFKDFSPELEFAEPF